MGKRCLPVGAPVVVLLRIAAVLPVLGGVRARRVHSAVLGVVVLVLGIVDVSAAAASAAARSRGVLVRGRGGGGVTGARVARPLAPRPGLARLAPGPSRARAARRRQRQVLRGGGREPLRRSNCYEQRDRDCENKCVLETCVQTCTSVFRVLELKGAFECKFKFDLWATWGPQRPFVFQACWNLGNLEVWRNMDISCMMDGTTDM